MISNTEQAKKILHDGGHTCVICGDGNIHTSDARGVKPLVTWYAAGECFSGYAAADKVVGRATAFLYLLLRVASVHAGVISRPALALLTANGIETTYDTLADNIINRRGDGICPFEEAVLHIDAPHAAYNAIRRKMEEMHITI